LPTVLLLEVLPPWLPLGRLPFGARIAGLGLNLVRARPQLIPALRAAGNQVYVWTVNQPADLELVLDCGVDGIITDRPALILDHLGR
jgi:glycerophosphoryl diester phosphodiesterase